MIKIAIIGGGLSGIASAVKLNELLNNGNNNSESQISKTKNSATNNLSYNITIFEAKATIGGRIGCIDDSKSGDLIDNGQHVAIGAYSNFFELLRSLGTINLIKPQESLEINYLVNKKYYLLKASNNYILKLFDLDLLIGLLNFNLLNLVDKISIVKFAILLKLKPKQVLNNSKYKNELHNLDGFLKYYKQTEKSIKYFWEPLCIATLNTNINEASSTVFLNVLIQGFFAGSEKSKLYLSKVGLAELIYPISNSSLFPNINVITNSIIKNLEFKNDKLILCYNQSEIVKDENENENFEFDYIINATNYDVFERLYNNYLDSEMKVMYLRLHSSPILSIYLWFDIELLDKPIIATPNSPIQWIFNKNLIDNKKSNLGKGFYCITISAADKLEIQSKDGNKFVGAKEYLCLIAKSNNEILEIVLNEIQELLPNDSTKNINTVKSHLLHYRIIKENKATFKCSPSMNAIRPEINDTFFINETLNDKVVVTGDWLKNDFPSTIEGAVLNGFKAAELLYSKINK